METHELQPPIEDDTYDDDDDYTPETLSVFLPALNLTYRQSDSSIAIITPDDDDVYQTNINDVKNVINYYIEHDNNLPQIEIGTGTYDVEIYVKSIPLDEYDLSNNNLNVFTTWQYNNNTAGDPNASSYNNTALILFYVADNNVFITSMICVAEKTIFSVAFKFIMSLFENLDNIENIYLYNGINLLLEKMPNTLEPVTPTIALSMSMPVEIPMIIDPDPNYSFMKFTVTDADADDTHLQPPVANISLIDQLQNPEIPLKFAVLTANAPLETRESIKRILVSNFTKYGDVLNTILYVVSNTADTTNDALLDNIMIPENNVFISYKTISTIDEVTNVAINNTYIMALLIYKVTSSQILVTHFVTYYNPIESNMYNNFVELYDTFKGLLDKYTWINSIYFYAAKNEYMDFFTNAYIGWSAVPNISSLRNILNLNATDEYSVMVYTRKKIYPQINLNEADFVHLQTIELNVPPDAVVFDFIEGVDVPINVYLANDAQNIVFITTHNGSLFYLASNRDTIQQLLFKKVEDTTAPDYANIFYGCKQIMHSLAFTADDLSGNTLYFNMAKIGASGTYMVELFELLHVVIDDPAQFYMIKPSTASLISTISVDSFCKIYPDLVSSAHCQEGQGGSIYNILRVNATTTSTANKRQRI